MLLYGSEGIFGTKQYVYHLNRPKIFSATIQLPLLYGAKGIFRTIHWPHVT